jgi:hypothetical protein
MSWSVSAVGKPKAVAASIAAQFATSHKCAEPEESIRQSTASTLAAAIEAQDPDSAVSVSAGGSQSEKYGPDGKRTGVFTNSLSVSVQPLYGFVE